MIRRSVFLAFFIGIFFCIGRTKVKAAISVSIPENFNTSDSFINDEVKTFEVTVASASGVAYLRPVFFKNGTSQYFGCAKGENVNTFTCGTNITEYPQITGSGKFMLTIKPNTESAYYTASQNSDVSFMVRRCTSSCSGGNNDSNVISVHLTTTQLPTSSSTPTIQPKNIGLSEVVACPVSGQSEWVEIVNNNNEAVTLTNWEIHDDTSTNKQAFSTNIAAHGLYVVTLTRGILNNSSDTVKLIDPDGNILESFGYNFCDSSKSWSKSSNGWFQTATQTPGFPNQFPTPSPAPTVTPPIIPSIGASASPTPSITATPSSQMTQSIGTQSGQVLGAQSMGESPTPTPQFEKREVTILTSQNVLIAGCIALVVGGVSLIIFAWKLHHEWAVHQKKKRKK
jgi:hypothetical protein